MGELTSPLTASPSFRKERVNRSFFVNFIQKYLQYCGHSDAIMLLIVKEMMGMDKRIAIYLSLLIKKGEINMAEFASKGVAGSGLRSWYRRYSIRCS